MPPFLYQQSLQMSRGGFASEGSAYLLFPDKKKLLKIFHVCGIRKAAAAAVNLKKKTPCLFSCALLVCLFNLIPESGLPQAQCFILMSQKSK